MFRVHDLEDELVLSVYQFNEDSGFFNVAGDLVGRVKIPVWSIVAEKNHYLPPTWFSLQKRKSLKSTTNKDYGIALYVLLALFDNLCFCYCCFCVLVYV